MKDTVTVTILPFETVRRVPPGKNLMEAITEAGLPLKSTCGGQGICGDCLVRIVSGSVRSRTSAVLPPELSRQGYILACQSEAGEDLVIQLPDFEEISLPRVPEWSEAVRHDGAVAGVLDVDPIWKRASLALPPPTLEDNASDLARLKREIKNKLGVEAADCPHSVLKRLAREARAEGGRLTAHLIKKGPGWSIVDVTAGEPPARALGLACDIGTTTVSCSLLDCENGEVLASASSFNRQIKCGEDIISRIHYTRKPGGLEELRRLAVATVNALIDQAAREAGASAGDIYLASVAGNTTMTHLLLGLDPRYIREEPYTPTVSRTPLLSGRDLELRMNAEGAVLCAPAVGSYVGGDITAGLLATPILRGADRISLFIDAGTNGELVVGNGDWLVTCACSAGPAFEGGGTKCGRPATEGAIEDIRLAGDAGPEYAVIGGGRPKGLCGSGLVDLLAELFVHGLIDRQGKFDQEKVGRRLWRSDHQTGFVVEESETSFWGKPIVITERDIANLIRSKGAIFSACSLLLKKVGLDFGALDAVYIAGGFGRHLDVENAVRIGLLPDIDRDRFHYLGNTSLLGASLILLSEKNRALVEEVAQRMTYIELNAEPGYMNEYTASLFLPHTELNLFPSVGKAVASRHE
jgi:uncharacterized 2Fe-2S/4Fe-4S cluster protein (DUF4445 family)